MRVITAAAMVAGTALLALPLVGPAIVDGGLAGAALVGKNGPPGPPGPGGNNGNTGTPEAFTVSGDASGLYPGRTVPIALTFTNLTSQSIQVTSLTGRVKAVANTACPVSSVTVPPWSGSQTVPARGTAISSALLTARMTDAAGDACADTTFTLVFEGTATR